MRQIITYFEDKSKSKLNQKTNLINYKTFITKLKSVDTIAVIGATTTSVNLFVTGIGLVVVPIYGGVASV